VNFDIDLAARRYLDGDPLVRIPEELYEAHAARLRRSRE
jgi:hypothetical protein